MSQIISFDFDDTIYLSTGEPHPITVAKMFHYHQNGDKLVIVTARNPEHDQLDWIRENKPDRVSVGAFINRHGLPVSEIYYANHTPKGPILQRIGAIRHYDDEEEQLVSAREYGVEAIHVKLPDGIKTWKELALYTEVPTP